MTSIHALQSTIEIAFILLVTYIIYRQLLVRAEQQQKEKSQINNQAICFTEKRGL